ncbi:MAG: glycosyltransferase [Bryobacteraceae bacterium]|nr:glycosyltransferase [Bryobacteraceae bacterium]
MKGLTVVIPVRGAPDQLAGCLAALARSVNPPSEVVVVDDGSAQADARRINAVTQAAGARLLRQRPSGPAAARNLGAQAARGEVLLFVDADVEVHAETVAQVREAFAQDPALAGLFGAYDHRPAAGTLVSDYRNLLHHYTHLHSQRAASTFWAGCGALRRDVFLAAGGFDPSYSRPSIEDVELGLRLTGEGHRIELRPEIQGTHTKQWTITSFLRTDLFARAIPWTEMLFACQRALPGDLNFGWARRLSVPLALLLLASLPLVLRLFWLGALLAAVSTVGLALLNAPFLLFLARRRSAAFALGAFPLHALHYAASGLGLVGGTWRVWRRRDPYGLAAVVALAVIIGAGQAISGTYAADFAVHPDEPSHFVNGTLVEQYLRHPTLAPMRFAEQYYLHFPRVAIGHWPPFFYAVEGLWFIIFGVSRTSALLLQALLGWALATAVYALARRHAASLASFAAASLLVLTRPFQEAVEGVMADAPTALLTLGAVLVFSRYLRSTSAGASLAFGGLSSLALLVKGSACPLAFVPLIAILVSRRWELLRRPDLWLSALPVLLTAMPWYLWAAQFSSPGHRAIGLYAGHWTPWLGFGLPLLLLALAGAWLLPKSDPGVLALVLGYGLALFFVSSFRESRHLLPAAAAAAVLSAGVWARLPRWGVLAALAALVYCTSFVTYPLALFRGHLPAMAAHGNLLVTGPGEGAIVAALAERDPAPRLATFRASRVLASSTFTGQQYRLLVQNEAETSDRLASLGIGWILSGATPSAKHDGLLDAATADWYREKFAGFTLARNPHPRKGSEPAIRQEHLGRRIQLGR